jgi:hypothetical protein
MRLPFPVTRGPATIPAINADAVAWRWQAAIMKKGNDSPFDIKSCYGIIRDMDGSMYEKWKLLSIE